MRPDASDGAGGPAPEQEPAREPAAGPDLQRPAGATARPAGGLRRAVPPPATLTGREQEIARLVLTGLTYKEIGAQLFISDKTVEHHVARIRRRLGATSRRELFGQLTAMVGPAS
jgi:DNA-binding CsgD family transcriptional regulator